MSPKSVTIMNKPQAEGKVHSRLSSRTQKKKVQHSSAIKNHQAQLLVYLMSFFCLLVWLNWIIKGQQQRHWLKIMVLDTFVLFNMFNYCRVVSYSEFAFHCFNSFWGILNLFFFCFFLQVRWIIAHSHLVYNYSNIMFTHNASVLPISQTCGQETCQSINGNKVTTLL